MSFEFANERNGLEKPRKLMISYDQTWDGPDKHRKFRFVFL